jgi:hypothetical protein
MMIFIFKFSLITLLNSRLYFSSFYHKTIFPETLCYITIFIVHSSISMIIPIFYLTLIHWSITVLNLTNSLPNLHIFLQSLASIESTFSNICPSIVPNICIFYIILQLVKLLLRHQRIWLVKTNCSVILQYWFLKKAYFLN